jgi:excisionase family DNA binding protein
MSNREQFLRTSKVAEILGVSQQTIYNWLKAEKIPEPQRNELTGWRLWSPENVERIRELMGEKAPHV